MRIPIKPGVRIVKAVTDWRKAVVRIGSHIADTGPQPKSRHVSGSRRTTVSSGALAITPTSQATSTTEIPAKP